jgi:hypothetical protein
MLSERRSWRVSGRDKRKGKEPRGKEMGKGKELAVGQDKGNGKEKETGQNKGNTEGKLPKLLAEQRLWLITAIEQDQGAAFDGKSVLALMLMS